MIIIGIDPGTAKTGYAVMEYPKNYNKSSKRSGNLIECACIDTPSEATMHDRLSQLYDELKNISSRTKPKMMVIEKLFFNTNIKTAMTVGQARGVSLLVASQHAMEVVEYTALQAKQTLTGYGRASKKEMQEAVREYMRLEKVIKPDDANDALAMILCHVEKTRIPEQN
ncbi:crossover junction endodeoxyribonuclease RuvC [Candidatus Nomurabacteria bacterium]|uniref:Crossover junction endodeoxyribonuclease RuvC n=1 Tax=candidate division WWE3 bacterium TaxID=2053526 RepID=A0A955E0F1_UNCKA|nr:crossover junction endodeoxyribonuclease RuvC [candidate division WWE3 bacterium]MCB9823698.1 crossover junction endodeoxyribonuclease RuvC [Candidatus Nomurabacteria bacterium]MCB9827224.1 crossover junction endodeoxyribonuclease RuvC [Candidatus Nomurabacteria bacterium]MCB9827493.1 crossover junction endodeoxyribonuclease RuvC [Candidatus Nomurabacteria bacterium]HXK52522.1 crossover junction endodeoxyribonuclease RuvC [bacterium]